MDLYSWLKESKKRLEKNNEHIHAMLDEGMILIAFARHMDKIPKSYEGEYELPFARHVERRINCLGHKDLHEIYNIVDGLQCCMFEYSNVCVAFRELMAKIKSELDKRNGENWPT